MTLPHLATIYRDFDIRGLYPEEITDEEVYKIARALALHFPVKSVAIGYDIRPSAEALYTSLERGFIDSGVAVIKLGLCTTPMTYFMCGRSTVDMTVMITASHMPSQFNGLKISIEDGRPVTGDILQIIKNIVGTHTFSEETTHQSVTTHALQPEWIAHFKKRHDLRGSNLSVVIDPANMIGVLEIATFKAFEPDITVHSIFDTYDHTCPNHEANPIKVEALHALACSVVEKKADLGIAFDGDADRVGFVDETGAVVPSDYIGALLARQVLQENPGATIVCDARASRDVVAEIEKHGGVVLREKVGHTHIRTRMRKENAELGIELSGHFFFKEAFYSEGGSLPAFLIMELLMKEKKPLSALVAEIKHHFQSGEVNSTITKTPETIYKDIIAAFPNVEISRLDGLTLSAEDWWCNVRPSANDPVMRLNVEASDLPRLEEKVSILLQIIRSE